MRPREPPACCLVCSDQNCQCPHPHPQGLTGLRMPTASTRLSSALWEGGGFRIIALSPTQDPQLRWAASPEALVPCSYVHISDPMCIFAVVNNLDLIGFCAGMLEEVREGACLHLLVTRLAWPGPHGLGMKEFSALGLPGLRAQPLCLVLTLRPSLPGATHHLHIHLSPPHHRKPVYPVWYGAEDWAPGGGEWWCKCWRP